jgi:hypothetical protein
MKKYLSHYGWHFGKQAMEYAANLMKKKNMVSGKMEKIEPYTKEQVEEMLKKYNVTIEDTNNYDFVFVANMGKADYLRSSIPDEHHLALYVKDVIEDPDAGEGTTFRRWIATMTANGEMIDWDEMM